MLAETETALSPILPRLRGGVLSMMDRRLFLSGCVTTVLGCPALADASAAAKLVAAAERQIGVTTLYDPAYVALDYPGGDVPLERGVCTDVVIRAYRAGLGLDLQEMVHADMRENFSAYPKRWGLKKPDRNIDHRRVPNLQTYFQRRGAELAAGGDVSGFSAGDIVTMLLPGNLPHIGIVSKTQSEEVQRSLIIHNIGLGTRKDDALHLFKITGRYRFLPG